MSRQLNRLACLVALLTLSTASAAAGTAPGPQFDFNHLSFQCVTGTAGAIAHCEYVAKVDLSNIPATATRAEVQCSATWRIRRASRPTPVFKVIPVREPIPLSGGGGSRMLKLKQYFESPSDPAIDVDVVEMPCTASWR